MKTIKVSEATGPALDWLVAKALGHSVKLRNWRDITDALDPMEDADIIEFHRERNTIRVSAQQIPGGAWLTNPSYSTNWSQGGQILEREGINLSVDYQDDALSDDMVAIGWKASYWNNSMPGTPGFCKWAYGPTPLIAAMRVFVSSKLGETAEVPEELT